MQGMLDNLSQPVAFATIPLNQEPVQEPPSADQPTPDLRRDSGSDTDLEEPILSKFSRKIGLVRTLGDRSRRTSQKAVSPNTSQGSMSSNKSEFDFEEEDDFLDAGLSSFSINPFIPWTHILMEGDELSGSFFLIPTGPEDSPAALKKENTTLKAEISLLKNRLEGTERVLKLRREQDVQLRDSIFQATREVSLFFSLSVYPMTHSYLATGTAGIGSFRHFSSPASNSRFQ